MIASNNKIKPELLFISLKLVWQNGYGSKTCAKFVKFNLANYKILQFRQIILLPIIPSIRLSIFYESEFVNDSDDNISYITVDI